MQMKPATANRASSSRRWDRRAGGGGGSRVIMADEPRSFNQNKKARQSGISGDWDEGFQDEGVLPNQLSAVSDRPMDVIDGQVPGPV